MRSRLAPHLPFVAPKKDWDLYERDGFAMPATRGVPPGYPDLARNAMAGELRSYTEWWERGSDEVAAIALAADSGETTRALPAAEEDAERLSEVLRNLVTELRRR